MVTSLRQQAEKLMRKSMREYQFGNFKRAMKLAEKTVSLFETAGGRRSHDFVCALFNLAEIKYMLRQLDDCEKIYLQLSRIVPEISGEDDALLRAAWFNLAGIYRQREDHERALPYYRRIVDSAAMGEFEPIILQSLQNMAEAHRARGELVAAIAAYKKALDLYEAADGCPGRDPLYGMIVEKYKEALTAIGDMTAAAKVCNRSGDLQSPAAGAAVH